MVVKHSTIDNTYLVYDEVERWLILEISVDPAANQLQVTHYGHIEAGVGTYYDPNEEEMRIEILRRPDRDDHVNIYTCYPIVSWEHCNDPMIVQ